MSLNKEVNNNTQNLVSITSFTKITRDNKPHYMIHYNIGSDVLKEVGFNQITPVRLQWCNKNNFGKLRIIHVHDRLIEGILPTITATKMASIYSAVHPSTTRLIKRTHEVVIYRILDDPRDINKKLLEIDLPGDFYCDEYISRINSQKINPIKTETIIPIKPPIVKKLIDEEIYQNLIRNGGVISINELCTYMRRQFGDDCGIMDDININLNGDKLPYKFILDKANDYRQSKNLPLFILR